jgi:hypothetical protein
MTRLSTPLVGASASLIAVLAWSLPARADDPSSPVDATNASETAAVDTDTAVAEQQPQQPQQPQPAEHARPTINHAHTGASLVLSGFVFLGLSYGPSLYVANRSGLPADHKLDIPIAGPWLDLGSRPNCAGQRSCSNEPGYTAALVLDGFIQAVSAIQILAGLGELSKDDPAPQKKASKAAIVVTPAALGSQGYGLGAIGRF